MNPRLAEARRLLQAGKHDAALKAARLAAAIVPGDAESHLLAAQLLLGAHQPQLAVEHSAAIARVRPNDPSVLAFHAGVLAMVARHAEAIPFAQRALQIDPDHRVALANLSAALVNSDRPADALEVASRGLASEPDDPLLNNTRAHALHTLGRSAEAFESLARVLRVAPMDPNALISSASFHNYAPNIPRERALAAHLDFGRFVMRRSRPDRPAMPDTSRRLRVGFVSADFREHSVSYFIESIFEGLPRDRFEVYAYSNNPRADTTTARLKTKVDSWRDLPPAGPDDHAHRIASDRVHAVIELAGLTRGHALHTLALRPAPLLISYLGYPNTTACPFIDARIVDTLTDPPDADAFHTERLVRLEAPFVCYRPPDTLPEITSQPDRPCTFGCFGAASKHNPDLLALWARAMEHVPGSRLVIKAQGLAEESARRDVVRGLQRHGIDPTRVDVLPPSSDIHAHLREYNRVDVALDTFPYNGTTTTCEALAMGVPVVTRVGDRHASRVGLSLLTSVGLASLAGASDEEFARAAAGAANRQGKVPRGLELREMLRSSPLGDARAHARRFGAALEHEILRVPRG